MKDGGWSRRPAFAVLAVCWFLACGREPSAPWWTSLARGYRPLPLASSGASPESRLAIESHEGGTDAVLHFELSRSDWEELGSGLWRTRRPVPMVGPKDPQETETRLEVAGSPITLSPDTFALRGGLLSTKPGRVRPDLIELLEHGLPEPVFAPVQSWIFYFDPTTRQPPERAELFDVLSRGEEQEGRWRVVVGDVLADGIPVLPGCKESLRVQATPCAATLRLATAAQGLGSAPLQFCVLLNGEPLLEHEQQPAEKGRCEWHAVSFEVPADGELSFSFEVEGEPAMTAFLDPVIGSGTIESPSSHPDVVFFLADTFRADNLAVHGGDPEWTPVLNEFAEQSVVFAEAHAPASWTLPSHATLFTGLHPYQAGTTGRKHRLPEHASTIAEHLSAQGYRTVAVTERGYVSRSYGLAQGFDWFEEAKRPLEETLDRVEDLLETRDGRPLFLFVHTYQTHSPYRVSAESRDRLGMEPELDWSVVAPQINDFREELAGRTLTSPASAPAEAVVSQALTLYRGGAADLDLAFGRFLGMLRGGGVLPDGYVLFTSDHGECFWEHGVSGHGRGVWEEVLHVPLLVHGPELVPRTVGVPVGLVALPSTICRLAGVDPGPFGAGRELLARENALPVLSYECVYPPERLHLALQLDSAKVILSAPEPEEGVAQPLHAYDLGIDPLEQTDRKGESWVDRLSKRFWPRVSRSLAPILSESEAAPGTAQLERLRELGYVDED